MAGMFDPDVLERMSHADLYAMRGKLPAPLQPKVAPYEHRAFAREFAQESPLRAAVSMPAAIPAYALAKVLGLQKSRTPASMEQVKQGYAGLLEGLRKRMGGGLFTASPMMQEDFPAQDLEKLPTKPIFTGRETIYSDTTPPSSWHHGLPQGVRGPVDEDFIRQRKTPDGSRMPMIQDPAETKGRKTRM